MTTTGVRSSARLSAEEQERLGVLQRSALLSDADREPFDRIARLTRRLLDVDTALVSIVDQERQVYQGHDGLREDLAARGGTDLSHSFCKFAVATGERLVVRDARDDLLLRDSPAIEDNDAVAYAGIPLEVSEGAVLGTLCVLHASPRTWTPQEVTLLEELAALALTEIEYRLHGRDLEKLGELALRLDHPVARLGDVVRTVAHLAEHEHPDPRLPRTADLARTRMSTVETLTQDLVRAAASKRSTGPGRLDVRDVLRRAGELALSAARADDLALDLPDAPVWVEGPTAPLGRALTLLVTTGLHHLAAGHRVTVRLVVDGGWALVRVRVPGGTPPVGELLRVVGHFRDTHGAELPVNVSSRGGVSTVRNAVASVTRTADGTTFEARIPTLTTAGDGSPSGR